MIVVVVAATMAHAAAPAARLAATTAFTHIDHVRRCQGPASGRHGVGHHRRPELYQLIPDVQWLQLEVFGNLEPRVAPLQPVVVFITPPPAVHRAGRVYWMTRPLLRLIDRPELPAPSFKTLHKHSRSLSIMWVSCKCREATPLPSSPLF